jgi:hypothetical protein
MANACQRNPLFFYCMLLLLALLRSCLSVNPRGITTNSQDTEPPLAFSGFGFRLAEIRPFGPSKKAATTRTIMSTVHEVRLPVSIEIPVNHEVRTIRGALRDRINIQAEPKSLDDIAADKERRGALRGAYLEEVKQKATRDLQRATAAAERKQATEAAEAARIVEKMAASASKARSRCSPSAAPPSMVRAARAAV